ncbi:MAG TPA: hypothetical protein VFB03_02025 [Candidatus Saccharimonadales bacterium]|nr:hypothetical protein [Candidatus Saccharimonadales bacterium]
MPQQNNQELGGADHNIAVDYYYSPEYVVENTVLPEDPDDIPEAIVAVSPGRSGSTALIGLMISRPEVSRGYYQPWKTLIRHGAKKYGQFVVPGKSEGVTTIFAKDTLGPFNPAEEFDPVELLLAAGYPPEKIQAIILMRQPLATYKSNLKFSGGIKPETFISNYHFAYGLQQKYSADGIPVVPFAYELTALGQEAINPLLTCLGLSTNGLQFDPQALMPYWQGGKFVPGESADSEENKEIVEPSFGAGTFSYMNGDPLTPADFAGYTDKPGAATSGMTAEQLVEAAAAIETSCGPVYENFVIQSANTLTNGDTLAKLDSILHLGGLAVK